MGAKNGLNARPPFNLMTGTELFMYFHIMFQTSFQNFKGQNIYHNFLVVLSELFVSIFIVSVK